MGAAWSGIVYGFAGIVNNADHFSLEPHLPDAWNCVKFRLQLHHCELLFTIYQDQVEVELMSGKGMALSVYNKKIKVTPEDPKQICQY
ncbi:glycosyl hydrolase family 65 protein [Lentilactobacillus kisonensis]|uniref:glycosyl hydrolase family 65 protein n=1 Tax=Lentilactobacillus kisonensis TaxID=481722 RepID=UPI000AE339A7|nr:glycosyl hydrolase family 65 protein [Lentilactobacillus kisonensis]